MSSIADIRRDYSLKTLLETEVAPNPFLQFGDWWQQAVESEIDEVNAMTLATASLEGVPSARIVLLKGYDERGFVFFTNYESAKGQELADNPKASLLFFGKSWNAKCALQGL